MNNDEGRNLLIKLDRSSINNSIIRVLVQETLYPVANSF